MTIQYDLDLFDRMTDNRSEFWSQSNLDHSQFGKLYHAIFILHEALYLIADELGHTDSSKVRELTSKLFSYKGVAIPNPSAELCNIWGACD